MNNDALTPIDPVEFFRTQERAAYERWRSTPGNAPELNARFAAWQRALKLHDAELLDRARRGRSETNRPEIVKRCTCCAATYSAAAWALLPFVGNQEAETEDGWPAVLELRNCPCGSTLGIELSGRTPRAARAA
jgi:hypothetical protein